MDAAASVEAASVDAAAADEEPQPASIAADNAIANNFLVFISSSRYSIEELYVSLLSLRMETLPETFTAYILEYMNALSEFQGVG